MNKWQIIILGGFMNYYDEIKNELINNEINRKVKKLFYK